MKTTKSLQPCEKKHVDLDVKIIFFILQYLFFAGFPVIAAEIDTKTSDLESLISNEIPENLFKVEKSIANVIQMNPRSAYGHYLYVKYLMRLYLENPFDQNVIDKVKSLSLQTKMLEPNREWHFLLAAEYFDLIGESEKATIVINQLLKETKIEKSWRAYFDLARYKMGVASDSEISELLKLSLIKMKGNPSIVMPYLLTHLRQSESQAAFFKEIQQLDKTYQDENLKMTFAQLLVETKHFNEAAKKYQEVMKLNPSNGEAQVNYLLIGSHGLKENKVIMEKIENIISHHEYSIPIERKISLYFQIGRFYLQQREFPRAQKAFLYAIKAGYDKDAIITEVFDVFSREKLFVPLENFLIVAANVIPGQPYIYGTLGRVYSEHLNRQDEAIASYKNALLLDPEKTDFYNGIGVSFYHMKDYTAAIKAFQAALSIDPNDALAHYNVACLLARFGKSIEALASLSKAISLDPNLKFSALSDTDLISLRSNQVFIELTEEDVPTTADEDVFVIDPKHTVQRTSVSH